MVGVGTTWLETTRNFFSVTDGIQRSVSQHPHVTDKETAMREGSDPLTVSQPLRSLTLRWILSPKQAVAWGGGTFSQWPVTAQHERLSFACRGCWASPSPNAPELWFWSHTSFWTKDLLTVEGSRGLLLLVLKDLPKELQVLKILHREH